MRDDNFLGSTRKWRGGNKILGQRIKENSEIQKLIWRVFEKEELRIIADKNGFKVSKIYTSFDLINQDKFNRQIAVFKKEG